MTTKFLLIGYFIFNLNSLFTAPIGSNTTFKNHPLQKAEIDTILGSTGVLSDQKDSTGAGYYLKYARTYTAKIDENGSEKTSNLYYKFERFASVAESEAKMNTFKNSNQNFPGYTQLTEYDGFIISDDQNFVIFIARKGKLHVSLKVNKLTSKTNLVALKKIGLELLGRV